MRCRDALKLGPWVPLVLLLASGCDPAHGVRYEGVIEDVPRDVLVRELDREARFVRAELSDGDGFRYGDVRVFVPAGTECRLTMEVPRVGWPGPSQELLQADRVRLLEAYALLRERIPALAPVETIEVVGIGDELEAE